MKYDLVSMLAQRAPHYNHSKLLHLDDKTLSESIIGHSKLNGATPANVISSFRDENTGEIKYVVSDMLHRMVIGTTGSGKSIGPIAAQFVYTILSRCASLVVIDPKGEFYARYKNFPGLDGYNVKLFNARSDNLEQTETLNPLNFICRNYAKKISCVGRGVEVCSPKRGKKHFYKYKNVIYENKKQLAYAFDEEASLLLADMMSAVKNILLRLFPIGSHQDVHWEETALSLLEAIVSALIVDQFSININQRTTEAQVNLLNVYNIFKSFSTKNVGRAGVLADWGFISGRGDSEIHNSVKCAFFEDAETTFRNHMMFVERAFQKYSRSMYNLTRCSTMDLHEFVEKPTVLFITYDEMDITQMAIVNLVVSSLLQEFKTIADSTLELSLPRPVLFMIDEFGALPKNEDIPTFITHGRSLNIFLHLVVQSYSQLEVKYGEKDAKIIRSCLTDMVYCGSADVETMKMFSDECGKCTIPSPSAILCGDRRISLEECPVVPVSNLASTELGEVYVKRAHKDTLHGSFVKSFAAPEYMCERTTLSDYRCNKTVAYSDYVYDVNAVKQSVEKISEDDDDDLF